MTLRGIVATTCVLCLLAGSASAGIISVGEGENSALIIINFDADTPSPGYFAFDVAFDGETTTSIDLLEIIRDAGIGFDLVVGSGGGFVEDIAYGGFYNGGGYVWPEGWWRCWVKDSIADPWVWDWDVSGGTPMSDGAASAWVWGSAAEPVIPEPATMSLLALGALAVLGRRRRA